MSDDMIASGSDQRVVNNTLRHNYRILSDAEKAHMSALKTKGQEFLNLIDEVGGTEPDQRKASRELSIAKTKIEEAVMWAVKHVTA